MKQNSSSIPSIFQSIAKQLLFVMRVIHYNVHGHGDDRQRRRRPYHRARDSDGEIGPVLLGVGVPHGVGHVDGRVEAHEEDDDVEDEAGAEAHGGGHELERPFGEGAGGEEVRHERNHVQRVQGDVVGVVGGVVHVPLEQLEDVGGETGAREAGHAQVRRRHDAPERGEAAVVVVHVLGEGDAKLRRQRLLALHRGIVRRGSANAIPFRRESARFRQN